MKKIIRKYVDVLAWMVVGAMFAVSFAGMVWPLMSSFDKVVIISIPIAGLIAIAGVVWHHRQYRSRKGGPQ